VTSRRGALAALALASLATLGLSACKDKPAAGPNAPAAADAPAVSGAKEAYDVAAKGHGFAVGQMMAANTVYVLFDSQCPHCAQLWQAAQPLHGKLKLVWMPVSLLGPASAPQGATILSASDPVKAMTENEQRVMARQGGITANPALPAGALDKVNENTQIFKRLGADSVPYIVYRNAKSGEHGVHAGAVSTEQLAAMTGV
jgi:thiol:disulfide interchange protein DsbG